MRARAVPFGLRISTLVLRSVLIFVLARYLDPVDVGLYGLMTVTISYVLFPLGLDFYAYATRELIREPVARRRVFLRSQVALTAVLYVLIGPALILLFSTGLLPWSVLLWFAALVPLEHLGAEIDRILIAFSDQFGASLSIFVRQGMLTLTVVPMLVFASTLRSIEMVLAMWVCLDLLGVLIGTILIGRHIRSVARGRVDWAWIRRGVKVCLPLLFGTMCLRLMFTVDRQVVKSVDGLDALGAYALFMGIGSGLLSALYAGVLQFGYPKLVDTAHRRDLVAFRRSLRGLVWQSVALMGSIVVFVLLFQGMLLDFVGNGVYREFAWALPLVLLVTLIHGMSLVVHSAVYALDADRAILVLTVASSVVFGATVAILVSVNAVLAVLVAFGLASVVLGVGKFGTFVVVMRRLDAEKPGMTATVVGVDGEGL